MPLQSGIQYLYHYAALFFFFPGINSNVSSLLALLVQFDVLTKPFVQIDIQYIYQSTHDPFTLIFFNAFKLITLQMGAALLECFLSATRLLLLRLRSSFVVVGGAAGVFLGSKHYTEDVDVAASSEAVSYFHGAIASGTTQFKCGDPSQTIEFTCSQDFIVHLELLQIGGGFVDSIAACLRVIGGSSNYKVEGSKRRRDFPDEVVFVTQRATREQKYR